jgi:hypothetical protein
LVWADLLNRRNQTFTAFLVAGNRGCIVLVADALTCKGAGDFNVAVALIKKEFPTESDMALPRRGLGGYKMRQSKMVQKPVSAIMQTVVPRGRFIILVV